MRHIAITLLFLLISISVFGQCNFVSVAGGRNHCVALKADGTVWTWGDNCEGQLGIGVAGGSAGVFNPEIDSKTPVQVLGPDSTEFLTDVVQIASGTNFSYALKSDGTLWAWGLNEFGQLGDGTTMDKHLPVQVRSPDTTGFLTGVVKVASSVHTAMALMEDSTVFAWGYNAYGQVGDESYVSRHLPVQVVGPDGEGILDSIIDIAEGGWHSYALKSDGTVWAWGRNYEGQLGNGTIGNKSKSPVQVLDSTGTSPLTNIVAVFSDGAYHSMAIDEDNNPWVWGGNAKGQLGDGTTANRNLAQRVYDSGGSSYFTDVVEITSRREHIILLKSDGTVWGIGQNDVGYLGDGTTIERHYPVQVLGPDGIGFLSGVISVGGGQKHTVAANSDGTAWSWGYNADGQLGDGTTNSSYTPVQVDCPIFAPNATVVSPRKYGTSSCNDLPIIWNVFAATDVIDVSSIRVWDGSLTFDTSDTRLTYTTISEYSGRLEFTPSAPWGPTDTVKVCVVRIEDTTGLSMPDTVCAEFYIDMAPPELIYRSPDSAQNFDMTPSGIEIHFHDEISGTNGNSWILKINEDSIGPGTTGILAADDTSLAFDFFTSNIVIEPEETTFLEFTVWDNPDTCPPNTKTYTWWFYLVSGIEEAVLPENTELSIWPNPFNSALNIVLRGVGATFRSPEQIAAEIFDINGRLVGNLPLSSAETAGETGSFREDPTPVIWTPDESLSSGIFLVRAKVGNKTFVKRVIYMK